MRRLPVFLLIDVSESMVGDSLYQLEQGLTEIARTLRTNPYALETAYLSVIAFAGKPRTLVPLTEMAMFQPPELPIGGGTALGAALAHLMKEIDRQVVRTTPDRKGDWKPLVFLLTDGHPTDDAEAAILRWISSYAARVNLVAVSIGGGADHSLLGRLTEQVILFNDQAPNAFARFVQWVSMSVQAQSRSVDAVGDAAPVSLAKSDADLIAPLRDPHSGEMASGVDDRYAVIVGKCAESRRPYLIKYERMKANLETGDARLAGLFYQNRYTLRTAVPVKNSYFELSDDSGSTAKIASADLIGAPSCPHCMARFGMAMCGCGGVHCIEGEVEAVCPWCDRGATYTAVDEDAPGPAINRGRG
ncbi:VWA domain-containing protein [Sphingomonas sp. ID1715]|uniref:TerY-C metal binding domain-containing protein n=1 Tax=Sphingomonas sp. ID1715 TaxID=1656898 RepID=UPI001489DEAD|nr:TerY-C metal binding domain-containing protein [Sphingomonas sp. ID1715]NNM75304.1 VWA domain-containing protein [Sphingomonas sp. ID1715]